MEGRKFHPDINKTPTREFPRVGHPGIGYGFIAYLRDSENSETYFGFAGVRSRNSYWGRCLSGEGAGVCARCMT